MPNISLIEAVNQALTYAMAEDPDVVIFGEDIATNGGVFRATVGLLEKYGPRRVLDTPLAESMLAGLAVGMGSQGLKPIVEFQFMGFIYPAFNQIISHAARMRNRTRGRLSCPAVFRAPYGGGIHAPEHHSESTEAIFAHIPGIRVVTPSSPQSAYGLLLAAIRDPDPVIFLEPKRIYRSIKQDVADDGQALPLDTCFTLREGNDVTLISWGAMVRETRQAAQILAEQGIEADVIDVATLKPLDTATIFRSVAVTGRCVIIHEAARSGGIGAEIAAELAEHRIMDLRAPIIRVTGYDTIMPYFQLEQNYLPSVDRIVTAATQLMEYA
jgi:2-oxoisovalerate dehydrogenase E1 component subunit beta